MDSHYELEIEASRRIHGALRKYMIRGVGSNGLIEIPYFFSLPISGIVLTMDSGDRVHIR